MFSADLSLEAFCGVVEREEDCIRALFESKWPDGFRCPQCGHPHAHTISTRKLPLYQCSSCDAQTSLIAGTIFQGTRTPLRLWFQAIFLHIRPEGINALQLSNMIKVTYKTAWLICHKIRYGMQRQNGLELLTGLVRITDAKMFTRTTASPAWHQQEQSVLVGCAVEEDGKASQLKIKKQNKHMLSNRYQSPPVEPFIREHVDRALSQQPLVSRNYFGQRDHFLLGIARHAQEVLARVFRGVGEKHLQVYLEQFCYVWNRGKQPLFRELLGVCSASPTITYPDLIGRKWSRPVLIPKIAASNKQHISQVS